MNVIYLDFLKKFPLFIFSKVVEIDDIMISGLAGQPTENTYQRYYQSERRF